MMKLKYQVYGLEKFYLFLQIAIGVLSYASFLLVSMNTRGIIGASLVLLGFLLWFSLWMMFESLLLAGVIKGNAVKASSKQFKVLFDIVNEQSEALDLGKVPKVYVLQAGGWINAFAAKFLRRYYVVLFAPVVEEAYKDGEETLRFIVGHELGHIKRNHLALWLYFLIFPAIFFPLLHSAYSRAREYTCDRIGYALSPNGALKGMGLLSVGPLLYKKLDMKAWLSEGKEELGFATALTELFSTHPHLINRVKALDRLQYETYAR